MIKKALLISSIFFSAWGTSLAQHYAKQYLFTDAKGSFSSLNNFVRVGLIKNGQVLYIDSSSGAFSNCVKVHYDHQNLRYEGWAHIGRSGGTDLLKRYDLDTYKAVDSIAVAGVQDIARSKDKLVVVKGYGAVGAKVDIFHAGSLDFIKGITEIEHNCTDVEIAGDSAFVSYSLPSKKDACAPWGCYADSIGYLSVINLKDHTVANTIELGAKGAGIKELVLRKEDDNRLHVYFDAKDSIYVSHPGLAIHNLKNVKILAVTENTIYGVQNGAQLEAVEKNKISNNKELYTIGPKGSYNYAFDTVSNSVLILQTDYATFGRVVRFNIPQERVTDTVAVGLSITEIAVDYRPGFPAGIASSSAASYIKIFPNPSKDHFFVQSTLAFDEWEIKNLEGRTMASGILEDMQAKITTESLATGIYSITLKGASGHKTVKFIKE